MRYCLRIDEGRPVLPVLPSWFELRSGHGCPLCTPRPEKNELVYFVWQLSVPSLYLARDQTYRGTCAVVYDPAHVSRPSELEPDAWRPGEPIAFDARCREALAGQDGATLDREALRELLAGG